MADEMVALANAVRARVETEAQVLAAWAIAAVSAQGIVLATADLVKTVVLDWVMRLSAPNAKPWSGPKCHCASWLHKRTARLLVV
jgi:hypothetical protein